MHEVRGSFTLASASKLASVDFIGTIDTSVTSRSVGGSVTISGTNPSLTKASFAGILAGASVTGATDLTDITTSGMIRAFTLDGSDDIETLTLGHKNITGITGTNGENAGNASSLTIQNNTALTSFSASELASLGTLIVKNNASLTAFTLKSTLSLGTALSSAGAAASETVNVDISGNDLTGSVQRPSAFNVSPAVTGKITQASLNGISTYLKAVEAAIKHGALTGSTGADASGWDRTTGLYTAAVTSGGSNTGYALTKANVVIDNLTSNVDADGVDAGDSSDYNVIAVTTAGATPTGYKNNNPISTIYNDYGTASTFTAGGVSSANVTVDDDADVDTDLSSITGAAIFAANGISLTSTKGVNKRTGFTLTGSVSTTSVVSITFLIGGTTHTVTSTTAASAVLSDTAAKFVTDFNAYTESLSSTLQWKATKVGNTGEVNFHSGSYSDTTFVVDVFNTSYLPNAAMTIYHPAGVNNTGAWGAQTLTSGYAITATSTSSPTASTIAGLGFSATNGVTISRGGVVTESTFTQKTPSTTYRREGEYASNGSGTAANITMRATWL